MLRNEDVVQNIWEDCTKGWCIHFLTPKNYKEYVIYSKYRKRWSEDVRLNQHEKNRLTFECKLTQNWVSHITISIQSNFKKK